MSIETKWTKGPWRWVRGENGEGYNDVLTLIGSPDDWKPCQYYCFGWKEGSPHSRGDVGIPGHEHNHAPEILSASGWHGSGDLCIDENSPNAHLIAAAPALYEALETILSFDGISAREKAREALAFARGEKP